MRTPRRCYITWDPLLFLSWDKSAQRSRNLFLDNVHIILKRSYISNISILSGAVTQSLDGLLDKGDCNVRGFLFETFLDIGTPVITRCFHQYKSMAKGRRMRKMKQKNESNQRQEASLKAMLHIQRQQANQICGAAHHDLEFRRGMCGSTLMKAQRRNKKVLEKVSKEGSQQCR